MGKEYKSQIQQTSRGFGTKSDGTHCFNQGTIFSKLSLSKKKQILKTEQILDPQMQGQQQRTSNTRKGKNLESPLLG